MKVSLLVLVFLTSCLNENSNPEVALKNFVEARIGEGGSFKFVSKSCQEKKCYVTYVVGYATKDAATKVEKIAEMLEEKDQWLIAKVSNVKTVHESLEPINPLE